MKKTLLFLLFIVSGLLTSQNRFKYQLKFKIDSTNREFVQEEIFNLDVDTNGSIFYSEVLAKLDSLKSANPSAYENRKFEPKLDYLISYDYNNQEVLFAETIGAAMYKVKEPREIKWTISDEVKKHGKYNVQKATTRFGNRDWIAWFSKDLSVFDGPYKFKGLPGLIVEMYDAKKDYVFELYQIQKINKLYSFNYFEKLGLKTLSVDYEKYHKLKKEDEENPEKALLQIQGFDKMNIPASQMKVIKEQLLNRRKKLNNSIELFVVSKK